MIKTLSTSPQLFTPLRLASSSLAIMPLLNQIVIETTTTTFILTVLLLSQQLAAIESHVINHKKNQNERQTTTTTVIKNDHHQFIQQNSYNNNYYNKPEANDKTPATTSTIEDMQKFRESLGKTMMSIIDRKADPCEDFYEYACGNWDLHQYAQEDTGEPNVNFYIGLKEDLLERLEYILTSNEMKEKYRSNKKYKALLKAREYYRTCMRSDDIFEAKPIPQYLEFVKEKIGFPAINTDWSRHGFDLSSATGFCNLFNSNCLFKVKFADVYPFCPILIPLDTFGLNNDMKKVDFENDDHSMKLELNKELMEYLLQLYGVDSQRSTKVLDDIIKFGHKLMTHSGQGNTSDTEINYLYEIEHNEDDMFDWHQYYKIAVQSNDVDDLYIILFKNREFFQNFSSSLFTSEDLEAISNYLSLNVLYQLHIEQRWTGTRKSYCLARTKIDFSFLIAAIYRDVYENHQDHLNLMNIFDSLKQTQVQIIESSDLYSSETKVNAKQKIQYLKVFMGYSNDPIIPELIELIENHTFSKNYYDNNIQSFLLRSKLKHHHSLSGANYTIQPLIILNPIVINASYNRLKNSIQLNAVGLRPPLHDSRYPKSIIYGAIGQMMAHEMSHVFDTDSLKLSENSELKAPWTDSDLLIYNNHTKCFVQQYNNKHFPEVNITVNGTKTLCENIADNGGLQLAYKAYKNTVNQMTYNQLMQEILPQTDWNHLQTFFIAHAQKYCSTYFRKQFLDESESPYSFMKLRVNVPLENLPEFGNSFNCPIGSKMNPLEKCSIF